MQTPKSLGFDELSEGRDRTQMLMVSLLARSGNRMVLKGGMAMRAIFGSIRLTKDVDYDCADDVPVQTLEKQVLGALKGAAQSAGLANPGVACTKAGNALCRFRLTGVMPSTGQEVRWEVEVSRRTPPPDEFLQSVSFIAPPEYRIQPFAVRAYSRTAMLSSKVIALLNDNRNVPRDVYDLDTLIKAGGGSPVPLWNNMRGDKLQELRDKTAGKVEAIGYDLARSELLPYLSPSERDRLTKEEWEQMQIQIAVKIEEWFDEILKPVAPGAADERTQGGNDHDSKIGSDSPGP